MARATELDPKALDEIADQVAESLPVRLVAFADSLQLGETFQVWTLATPLGDTSDVSRNASFACSYYLQLYAKGKPVGFVRSRAVIGDVPTWEVTQVFESPLARAVDRAIQDIDRLMPQDVLTRILFAPAYQLSAFWFVKHPEHPIYVVSCPATFTRIRSDRKMMNGADFLRGLKEEKPILGRLSAPLR